VPAHDHAAVKRPHYAATAALIPRPTEIIAVVAGTVLA